MMHLLIASIVITATPTVPAVVPDVLIQCLSGRAEVIDDSSIPLRILCPSWYAQARSDQSWQLSGHLFPVFVFSNQCIAPVQLGENWTDNVVVSTVPLTSVCPDVFVYREFKKGQLWFTAHFLSDGRCCVYASGLGTLLHIAQGNAVRFESAEDIFAPPRTEEATVPSEVIDAEAISFLPEPQLMRGSQIHLAALILGVICLIPLISLRRFLI